MLRVALLCALATASALYDEEGDVVSLTTLDTVKESAENWLVEFYAPWCGHCQKLAPEYTKAAKALRGVAKLGAVDCDVHKSVCQTLSVSSFPTLKWFDEDKLHPEEYKGERDAAGIEAFVQEKAGEAKPSPLSPRIKYSGTYTFLYQSELGLLPKALLFTAGTKKTPSWWTSLAVKYKNGKKKTVAFGHVNTDDEPQVAKRFGISEFPAMVVVISKAEGEGWFAKYDNTLGESVSQDLKKTKSFVDSVALDAVFPEDRRTATPAFPAPDKPRKLAATSMERLTPDNINSHCYGTSAGKSICLMALVTATSKSKEESTAFAEAAIVSELSRKYRNDPFFFGWVDASTDPDLMDGFGLEASTALPQFIAVKTGKRNRFAIYDGEPTVAGLSSFLDRILGGDMQFKMLKSLPAITPEHLKGI